MHALFLAGVGCCFSSMRLGYSATVRALWLSALRVEPISSRPQRHICRILTASLSTVTAFSTSARSISRSSSLRLRRRPFPSTLLRSAAPRIQRPHMSGVHSLSADNSLIFLEHYTTRLTRSKLQCTYIPPGSLTVFACTLSIALPPSDSSSLSLVAFTPLVLSCTSPILTSKKRAKAAAALMLCRQLIDKGEFEPFAVFGQPDKFAFSSKREKRSQAARLSQMKQPADLTPQAGKGVQSATASLPSRPSPVSVAPSDRERPRDRMVLLSGLDAAEQITATEIRQRLSMGLPHCPAVHPFESAVNPRFTAYLLHFDSATEAEEAVAVLDGRQDVVEGQRLTAHIFGRPAEEMIERAWYPPPPQLAHDWLQAREGQTGADYYYFYGYRCDLFDRGNTPHSLVLLCPAALHVTQPLMLYQPAAPWLTAAEHANQQPRQFDICYAGSCRLSEAEMEAAQEWWARMAQDFAKRGTGQWLEEQRRYLLLPVIHDAENTSAPQQPATDSLLISSFSSRSGITVDWELINRCLSDAPAMLSVNHFDSDSRSLSTVILTTPHDGLLYLSHGLAPFLTASPSLEWNHASSNRSFATYLNPYGHQLDPASPLIQAQHLPSFAVDLTRPQPPSSSAMSHMLAPQQSRVHPISAQLWCQLRCVASFMYALESQLLTQSLADACRKPVVSLSLLQAALTSRAVSSGWNDNYERLEFLGDSFIKYSVSSHLFTRHTLNTAAHLTRIRADNINNRNLARNGQRQQLLPAIRAEPFQPAKMSFAGVPSLDEGQISAGVVADVVEAMVGAYCVEQGEAAACKVARWLGLQVSEHDSDNGSLTFSMPPLAPLESADPRVVDCLASSVPQLEQVLSYSFREPLRLLHALTHSSAGVSFNNERLEWLGDAVLDWLVTRAIFASSTNRSPGEMTTHRASLVNRDAYAFIAVRLGLQHHLLADQQVSDLAAEGAAAVEVRWGAVGGAYEASGGADLTAFKVLCDLLESVMGAVYVDCGMDVTETNRVWEHIAAVEETSTGMRLVARSERHNWYDHSVPMSKQFSVRL